MFCLKKLIFGFTFFSLALILTYRTYAISSSQDGFIIQTNEVLQAQEIPNPQLLNQKTLLFDTISFSLDSDQISFDPLAPTNPLTRAQNLTLKSASIPSAMISLIQDQLFTDFVNNQIPNTSCDNGTCTLKKSDLWSNTLTYGFGFRCEGTFVCEKAFTENDAFRPLPLQDSEAFDINYPISTDIDHLRYTYKLNVAGSQPRGTYRSNIRYIILPNI